MENKIKRENKIKSISNVQSLDLLPIYLLRDILEDVLHQNKKVNQEARDPTQEAVEGIPSRTAKGRPRSTSMWQA